MYLFQNKRKSHSKGTARCDNGIFNTFVGLKFSTHSQNLAEVCKITILVGWRFTELIPERIEWSQKTKFASESKSIFRVIIIKFSLHSKHQQVRFLLHLIFQILRCETSCQLLDPSLIGRCILSCTLSPPSNLPDVPFS